MGFSGSMLTPIPPPTHLFAQNDATKLLPFQIRCNRNSDFEASKKPSLSRRDAIISLTALSSVAVSISSPDIAEARVKRGEMRRKIKEKLELLREKASGSKQKESDEAKSPPTPPYTKKENNLRLKIPPLPLPEPPLGLDKSLVEATYDL